MVANLCDLWFTGVTYQFVTGGGSEMDEAVGGGQISSEIPRMPGAGAFEINGVGADEERNAVFESLVTGDTDIVGLVAYSIYKQNKHDWLVAFERVKARQPNDGELSAYIIGESTPRRLATYRHLAEATLEGRGPEVPAGPAAEAFAQRTYSAAALRARSRNTAAAKDWSVATWVALAVVFVVAVLLAARFGIPGLISR
jgi:hypothetical protein